MLSGLAFGVALLPASPLSAGGIVGMDLSDVALVLRFDEPASGASTMLLDGPRRIAVDIDGVQARGLPYAGDSRLVSKVRHGQFSGQTARVVLDLKETAVVSSARFSADGRTLTMRLRDVDKARYAAALRRGRSMVVPPTGLSFGDAGDSAAGANPNGANPNVVPMADFSRPPSKMHSITVPIPPAAKGMKLPRIYGPAESNRPLVVIDAGHGGHDPGAINSALGKREKDITLAIAKAIRDELIATGRVRVALTREDDRFLILQERYGLARKMGADLFISVHADAAENDTARGATVYTLSETASDREAARLAARENKADIINGVNLGGQDGDVSSILIDLTQRETLNLSASFAQLLQREASPYVNFRPGYHKFASLMVLKAPDMPSVLFETGYISNPQDAQRIASRQGQREIAKGVASAINVHFARRLAMR